MLHDSRWRKLHANRKAISSLASVTLFSTCERGCRMVEKTAKILRHQHDCHEEDGACTWPKHKIIITADMPDMKKRLYGQLLG